MQYVQTSILHLQIVKSKFCFRPSSWMAAIPSEGRWDRSGDRDSSVHSSCCGLI